MGLFKWTVGALVLSCCLPGAEGMSVLNPMLCYILDGFLALYGLFITAMFIKEKFFTNKNHKGEDSIYSDLKNPDEGGYAPLRIGDPESGRNRKRDEVYTPLRRPTEDEYKELPMKERRKRTDQVYQDLSSANKDTYNTLQLQPLPPS